ncbi:hypothetical protein, partial [Halomonas sp. ND22Bw]|uniref:hypothetical protein n=1 Tax=Halomonas sp. ND22Bw TaxID=2054178 RepID=UPI0034E0DAD6
PGRELYQPRDDREDILDAVAQFLADHLTLFERQFLFVDVGARPEPADDLPRRAADRQRTPQR